MRMRVLALLVSVLLGTAAGASAQFAVAAPLAPGEDFHVELGAMLWRPTSEIRLQTGAEALEGSAPADLTHVLGLERRRVTEYRLVLKPGRRHRFRFSYLPLHIEQESIVEESFVLGDASFAAGDPAMVDIRWDQWRFGYQYDLASTERALLGLVLEARRTRMAAEVVSDQAQALEEQVTVPAVGFVARGYIHRSVSLTLEFAGFGVPGRIGRWLTDDDIDVTSRDLDLYVTGNLSRHLGLQGGYRRVRTEYVVDGRAGDLKSAGWYVGAVVRF